MGKFQYGIISGETGKYLGGMIYGSRNYLPVPHDACPPAMWPIRVEIYYRRKMHIESSRPTVKECELSLVIVLLHVEMTRPTMYSELKKIC